jgi:hypothetical protein
MSSDSPKSTESTDTPTTGTSIESPRQPTGFAATATKLLEAVGVLNKGSSESAATPKANDAEQMSGISSNALNVTRVGGLAALIAAVGAAALAIFNVNKATDKASIVVAAYISVGVIIASALLTVAIIISSDIRARAASNPTSSPSDTAAGTSPKKTTPPDANTSADAAIKPAVSPSETTAGTSPTKTTTTDADTFGDAWYRALSMLHDALDRLEHTPDSPDPGWVDGSTAAWLDAVASTGRTQNLHPADDGQATLHARLSAAQSSIISLLNKLGNDRDSTNKAATIARIRSALDSMDKSLPWPN